MAPTVSPRHHAAHGNRDVRLDFFRGLAMFFILIAHTPQNPWAVLLPGRLGFSDSTEIFVFCSGMASAIAFGRVFDSRGFVAGVSRVAHRVWQVYWAHICVFLASVAAVVAADAVLGTGSQHLTRSGLGAFFAKDVPQNLLALMTLTYLPGLFDILPMYLVILAMLPIVMLVSRAGVGAVAAFVLVVYAIGTSGRISLPSEPGTAAVWYFNPFAWQLLFFLGFAFMRGWIPPPRHDRRLVAAAIAVIVAMIPFAFPALVENFAVLGRVNHALWPLIDKTDFRPLRLLHFLSVAYLAYLVVGEAGARLQGAAVQVIAKVGQQALAVFMAGTVLAQLSGVTLHEFGRGFLASTAVTLAGCAALVATAYAVAYFKSSPWLTKRAPHTEQTTGQDREAASHPERGHGKPMAPAT